MEISDKEILDFVKENITIVKGMTGHIVIKDEVKFRDNFYEN